MIREAQRSELPAILELWLESTTWGHPFIKANYWRDCIPLVRDAYLANAQNWVWEEDACTADELLSTRFSSGSVLSEESSSRSGSLLNWIGADE